MRGDDMKKIKLILIIIIIILVGVTLTFAITLTNKKNIDKSIIFYNGEEYEPVKLMTTYTENKTEVTAYISKVGKDKKTKKVVFTINGTNDEFIQTKLYGDTVLFHKKSSSIPSFYDIKNLNSAEFVNNGDFSPIPEQMQNKLFEYIKTHQDNMDTISSDSKYTSRYKIAVTYNDYPEIIHYIGDIIEIQGDFAFLPTDQDDYYLIFGRKIIFLPFNPVLTQ